jgi:hypothetical protein
MAAGQEFIERNFAHTPSERFDLLDRVGNLRPTAVNLGNEAGDRATVSGDADRCAPLHIVEELGKMGFGGGGLNFSHFGAYWTGRSNRSKIRGREMLRKTGATLLIESRA